MNSKMELMAVSKSISSSGLTFTIQTLQKSTSHPKLLKLQNQQQQLMNSSPFHHYEQINLEETKQIHTHMIKTHFNGSNYQIPFVSFQKLSTHLSRFNFIITSYINNKKPKEALNIYAGMRKNDITLDTFIVPTILKACGQLSWSQQGKEIHGFILKIGLDWDVFVQNALIQMYSETANMDSACCVFNTMPERDVVSWSTMIRSYSSCRFYDEALDLIREMQFQGVKPSVVSLINMVNLFADLGNSKMARPMHAYVVKNIDIGSTGLRIVTALIDMYAKCGSVALARKLFDRLNQKSIVSWTAMIAGYIRCNMLDEGVELFVKMLEKNIYPNDITILSLIVECGFSGAIQIGKQLHGYMFRNGFDMSFQLATALVGMYGKCGEVKSARRIFDGTGGGDVMLWSEMISVYAKAGCVHEAFSLFEQMTNEGVQPNEVTMANLLSLCAEAGALDLGKWVHAYIDRKRIMSDVILSTALVNMYAKCGDIDTALRHFRGSSRRDIGMWNAMIAGLAMNGCGQEALELFSELELTGAKPDGITFIGALHACSHAGLVAEGERMFSQMVDEFGVEPEVEHYGCMVDLLGRAGKLEEAHQVINSMPIKPNTIVWGALLAACKLHKNPSLGELAAKRLLELEPQNCGYNVLVSNIYATANRWNDVAHVRKAMKDTGIKKAPGLSSIEVNGEVHQFIMGDKSHPRNNEIDEMLTEMNKKLKSAGYIANISSVLLNIDEEEKETTLTYHSEKLAMAFGLISTAPNSTIRIVKNLRVCDDSHSATKLLSKIYGRMIIVRDRNRFHHFSDGTCSCKDYW